MFFPVITKNLNWEILTKNVVTFIYIYIYIYILQEKSNNNNNNFLLWYNKF